MSPVKRIEAERIPELKDKPKRRRVAFAVAFSVKWQASTINLSLIYRAVRSGSYSHTKEFDFNGLRTLDTGPLRCSFLYLAPMDNIGRRILTSMLSKIVLSLLSKLVSAGL
eukprot:Gb_33796 [translate_table: standard]